MMDKIKEKFANLPGKFMNGNLFNLVNKTGLVVGTSSGIGDLTDITSDVLPLKLNSFCKILSIRDFSTFKIFPRSGKIAWVFRSRACLAEPPAESPSKIGRAHV